MRSESRAESTTDGEKHPYEWAVNGSPIGAWETRWHVPMHDALRLDENGTALWVSHSGMRGEERFHLEWRHEGPGRIRIRYLDEDEFPPARGDEQYGVIRYEADWIPGGDGERTPVLRSANTDGFWMLLAPIFAMDKRSATAFFDTEPEAEATPSTCDEAPVSAWASVRHLFLPER